MVLSDMKLDIFVQPADIRSLDRKPVLLRDVLRHLLFLISNWQVENPGKVCILKPLYEVVALDLLEFAGVAVSDLTPGELHQRKLYIVK